MGEGPGGLPQQSEGQLMKMSGRQIVRVFWASVFGLGLLGVNVVGFWHWPDSAAFYIIEGLTATLAATSWLWETDKVFEFPKKKPKIPEARVEN